MKHDLSRRIGWWKRLVFCAMAFSAAWNATAADQPAASPNTLCVMSYNLKFASSNPPNAWPQRLPLMRECIQSVNPDVIGTQEGLYGQLKDLAAALDGYEWIGLGRDGGSKGEFMAIFYRKSRLEPLAFDHFWLSDTPEVIGSTTWGNSNRRMATWVKFLDRQTKREFYLLNTHFDHRVQVACEKSATLVRQRVESLKTTSPVVMTGDFNAGYTNRSHQILVADDFFRDTWDLAKQRRGEGLGTFNDFTEVSKGGLRIDWILVRGKATVDSEEIVTFSRDGQFPSDHCPLVARMILGE